MNTTIAGFKYSGDKIYLFKKIIILCYLFTLSILSCFFFSYLDFNHWNFLNYTIYKSGIYSQNSLTAYFTICFIISLRFFATFFACFVFLYPRPYPDYNIKYIFQILLFFVAIICAIEIFFIFIILIIAVLLFGKISSRGSIIPLIFSILTLIASLFTMWALDDPKQTGIMIVVYFSLYILVFTFLSIRFLLDKTLHSQIGNQEYTPKGMIKPAYIYNLSNSDLTALICYQENVIIAKGNEIYVYFRNNLKKPIHILKGHENHITEILATNTYLITQSETLKYGLWEINNSFNFSQLHRNIAHVYNEDKLKRIHLSHLQVDNDRIYYNVGNKIYVNDSNFVEPARLLTENSSENRLMDFKISENKVYSLLQNPYSTIVWVEVDDLDFKTSPLQIQVDIDENNLFYDLVVNDKTIIITGPRRILIFELGLQLEKVKEIEFETEDIRFLDANKNYFLIQTSKNGKKFLKIYSNNKDFNLLKEMDIPFNHKVQFVSDTDFVIFEHRFKNIFQFNINSLLGL